MRNPQTPASMEDGVRALEARTVRDIALDCLRRMKQTGESHEMCARWISEKVSPLLSNPPLTGCQIPEISNAIRRGLVMALPLQSNSQDQVAESVLRELLPLLSAAPPPQPDGWRPIASAPKDGSLIEVKADCISQSAMHWNATRGLWESPDGFIWSVTEDLGPTHWRPLLRGPVFPNYQHQPGLKYCHTFGFVSGTLGIYAQGYGDKDGSGYLAFQDEALDWELDRNDRHELRTINICREDLIALRDKLLEAFPLPKPPQPEAPTTGCQIPKELREAYNAWHRTIADPYKRGLGDAYARFQSLAVIFVCSCLSAEPPPQPEALTKEEQP